MNLGELTPVEAKWIQDAIAARMAIVDKVVDDAVDFDERIEFLASLDTGAALYKRLATARYCDAKERNAAQ